MVDALDLCPHADSSVDGDGDGWADGCDDCPTLANSDQSTRPQRLRWCGRRWLSDAYDGVVNDGCGAACDPVAEACGNGLDEDCDGTADDGCGSVCSPVAENCANNLDDDCDGVINDGCGVACDPSAEVCGNGLDVCGNHLDEDCDGAADDGCGSVVM